MASGRVYLIGAGPGDPELMTLAAVRALGEASVVLADELVDRRCLAHTKGRVIDVGKRGGCRIDRLRTPQAFIERLMIRLARAGETVARLKGGDPFIFGRGGEELAALHAAGIAVEVVPGITAGIGVAASLGLPLTQRGLASGVTFVAGHSAQPANWRALRDAGTTVVIYMGLARLRVLVAEMLAGGFPARTPACAVQEGTRERERAVFAPLGALADSVENAALAAPALIVVGETVTRAAAHSQGEQSSHVCRHH
jgi:uroporphyrin-III C-methyltransferase